MLIKQLVWAFVVVFTGITSAYAALNDYLITQPIGVYRLGSPPVPMPLDKETRLKQKPWSPFSTYSSAGPLQGTGHFNVDHRDTTYRIVYENTNPRMAVRVHVTQHPGVDSDKWLLHEVEDTYRGNEFGILSNGVRIRELNGSKFISMRGNAYAWVSNNVVVDVSYMDYDGTKPEPLEIIQAYLQKFPSIIQIKDAEFKSQSYNKQWIMDEMDRLLWLTEKWFAQMSPEDPEFGDDIKTASSKLSSFLDYREKYFSVSSSNDKQLIATYVDASDAASLGKKLEELKAWWKKNRH